MDFVKIFIAALRAVIYAAEIIIVIRVLCEFKAIHRDSRPFQFLLSISEPLLNPVRRMLLKEAKEKQLRFDISPFVVLILLYLVNTLLKNFY